MCAHPHSCTEKVKNCSVIHESCLLPSCEVQCQLVFSPRLPEIHKYLHTWKEFFFFFFPRLIHFLPNSSLQLCCEWLWLTAQNRNTVEVKLHHGTRKCITYTSLNHSERLVFWQTPQLRLAPTRPLPSLWCTQELTTTGPKNVIGLWTANTFGNVHILSNHSKVKQ